ncbi:MAG: serine hydrolase [Phormidesmis sp.]
MQLTNELIQTLNEALEGTRTPEVPGAAAAILSPDGDWFGASGVANVAENTPLQPSDRFEAGSIAKTFLATTLLQLTESGQLSLEDTLTDWLPTTLTDSVPNASEITIKQILGHTSGIADYLDVFVEQARANPTLFVQDWQSEQLLGFLEGVEPFFEPGESWQYSNTNYILVGAVIEAVIGNSYGQEVRDRILDPLNLQDTFIAGEEEIPGGYIKGYWDFDANGTLDDLSITNLSWAGSAGSLISNTADLAAFFDALLKDKTLLQPETLAQMLDTIPVDSPNYDAYGLGIGTIESPNRFWYAHRGQTLGFRSNLWYSPAEEITYVELINGRSTDNLVADLLPVFRNGLENNTGMLGTDEADVLVGDAADNMIDGKAGDDTIAGESGDDILLGGEGDDVIRGDRNTRNLQNAEIGGNDIIFGGNGSDRIGGKSGNDILSGDAGDDFIWGDGGDDIIMGGSGNDLLVGDNFSQGAGSDLFVFGNGDGTDTILDFEVGIDKIGLIEGELSFAELSFVQSGRHILLGVARTSETLAVINNAQAADLDESSFSVVADVSNLEDALMLI